MGVGIVCSGLFFLADSAKGETVALEPKDVQIVSGPLVHGFEGDGKNFGGSGSRSFYFLDPDGNRLEIDTDMMRVPNGEPFPRQEYAAVLDALKAEAGSGVNS